MKKRVLFVLLALVMCLGLLPAPAFAADDGFTIENGVLVKYNGPGGDVVIPEGVTTGATATTFDPNGICNRGEIVTFLYRAYK